MFVEADLRSSPPSVALREPDDFRSLKVVVRGALDRHAALLEALAPVGELDDQEHAFLAVDGLKRLAGDRARDEQWLASFDAMVEYARDKGWVAEDGASLQAHCEWAGEDA
jgi:hypothetical protein